MTEAAQLDDHIGQLITIRGEVSYTKIPSIIGVQVLSHDPDLRGRQAEATGILHRYVVTPEEIHELNFGSRGPIANRGPGVFYKLYERDTNYTASVRPVSP
ncbi:MAG: hypothetical protein AAF750_04200 [Planctomycetota bacterium]